MKPCPVVAVAILVRVSTKRQETERQVHELRTLAVERGWQVIEVVEKDGVSGAAKDADRHGLARVEVLAAARRAGKVLGRPVGTVMTQGELLERHADVVRLLRAGKSLRDVAARTGKGATTVKRIKAMVQVERTADMQSPTPSCDALSTSR